MNPSRFKGTGVALVTPFTNGQIDYQALKNLVHKVVDGGVDYIVSLGTTGEASALSPAEQRKVVDITLETNAGRVPVIVGGPFGGSHTLEIKEKLSEYNFSGIQGILSSSPAYVKPTQEGIYRHYMTLAETSPLPIIIYNVPGRTASNILPETLLRLHSAAPEIFVAVKEASADLVQGQKLMGMAPPTFTVLSGDDPTALALISTGASGVISVIANAYPAEFSDMVRTAIASKLDTARTLNDLLYPLHPCLYVEGNPAGIKALLELQGHCKREVRLPLAPYSDQGFELLRNVYHTVETKRKTLIDSIPQQG